MRVGCVAFLGILAGIGLVSGHGLVWAQDRNVPIPARLVLSKAQKLMATHQYQKALELLTDFHANGNPDDAKDPKGYHHPEIWFAIGNCHLYLKQTRLAERAFKEAVSRDSKHFGAWANLARIYYDGKDYTQAANCFLSAYAASTPKQAQWLYYSAVSFFQAGKSKLCIQYFDQLEKAHPGAIKSEWQETRIHALMETGNKQKAASIMEKWVHHLTGDQLMRWRETLLFLYVELNRPSRAIQLLHHLLAENPLETKWWKLLAQVHLHSGNSQNALAAFKVMSMIRSLNYDETRLMADLYLQEGVPGEAAALYESCLKTKVDADVLYHLAICHMRMGRDEQALDVLKRMPAKIRNPGPGMLRADILYRLKRYGEAADSYQKMAQTSGSHRARAWLMAGYAACLNHDPGAARQYFEQAGKFKSQKNAAKQALKQLEISKCQ